MIKRVSYTIILVIVSFATGILLSQRFTATSKLAQPESLRAGGPVLSINATVAGKVVEVKGTQMIVEGGGKRLTVKSANKVTIFGPGIIKGQEFLRPQVIGPGEIPVPKVATPSEILEASREASPGATTKSPSPLEFTDFSVIPLGSRVSVILELQTDGSFLAKSVILVPPTKGY